MKLFHINIAENVKSVKVSLDIDEYIIYNRYILKYKLLVYNKGEL